MSTYRTDEEQLELIKQWWKKYGNYVSALVLALALSVMAYRYWHTHQIQNKEQASKLYKQMIQSYSAHQNNAVKALANMLIKEHQGQIYADAAYLLRAKIEVDEEQWVDAQKTLEEAAQKLSLPALKQVAIIRLARLWIYRKDYKKALHSLDDNIDPAYRALLEEVKGDAFHALGNYVEASKAYQIALNQVKKADMSHTFLEMKAAEA